MNDASVLPAPAPSRPRIDSLDVVRGAAIVGTLGTNIWVFSHPWGLVGAFGMGVPSSASPRSVRVVDGPGATCGGPRCCSWTAWSTTS
ncbi:hypothetical protein F6B41_18125 [Microbacterium lushaniae]|nr:hypothetical protein F6B41_20400 [Microbacterium lushaniae]KAA9152369.1 hypothetical protein F6B41_18125 [Microbacterium lushaniae]